MEVRSAALHLQRMPKQGDTPMTLLEVINDKRNPKDIPSLELNEMMRVIRVNKFWAGPYFDLDKEQQRRAVREWVHEDVFGWKP